MRKKHKAENVRHGVQKVITIRSIKYGDVTFFFLYFGKVSYGAMDPVFHDRTQFPSFYRTIPNEEAEMDGIVQILKHFGWKWVGLIVSDDDTGYRARERISTELAHMGGCLAFSLVIEYGAKIPYLRREMIFEIIKKTQVKVLVVFISTKYIFLSIQVLFYCIIPERICVTCSVFADFITSPYNVGLTVLFNGALSFLIREGEIPQFNHFLNSFSLSNYPQSKLTEYIWQGVFHCIFPYLPWTDNKPISGRICTGNESMSRAGFSQTGDYRVTYRVYTAVYALARALHNLYSAQAPTNHWDKLEYMRGNLKPWQINTFVRNVTFVTPSGDTIFFNDKGDPPAQFDVMTFLLLPNRTFARQKIGSFHVLSDGTKLLHINSSADLWGPYYKEMPQSLCNEPCAPGYRKAKIEGKPSCCYDCAKCADGEMSNTTDALDCLHCSEYEKSNKQRTGCVPKEINYLSYTDTLGASLTSIALVLFIAASVVLGIFVRYWETPIVRANNQNLSFLLLISLMLCFLCTLLFIGRPTQICCLLRQVTFGIVFTISVSSVLAKTLTVIIAFNATKPGSKLKKYVGTQLAIILVIVCCLGEMMISAVWMASNPPFLDADTLTDINTVFLMCNEGSVLFFFSVIGYMTALALFSFIAAFLAKDFPDRFNEAKNITFSMLGFCSVWGAFVPAYLSSKGSRMVAVEIFAILSSSAGLLACIFVPKCYIIFFRPEQNSKKM
uniref:G-protein coupled receptors family 3 profile domain-containing protein n=1 Tax=Xenopus tropicalis TaxID=8364 RepID=A0A803KFX9_XENTR